MSAVVAQRPYRSPSGVCTCRAGERTTHRPFWCVHEGRHFGDGVGSHEQVDLDEIGSAGIGDTHGYSGQPLAVVHFRPEFQGSVEVSGHVQRGRFHAHAHMISA